MALALHIGVVLVTLCFTPTAAAVEPRFACSASPMELGGQAAFSDQANDGAPLHVAGPCTLMEG